MKEKYTDRKLYILTNIVKQVTMDNFKGKVEILTKLRNGAVQGTGGLRPE